MMIGGVIALPAGYLTIRMMQTERVSISMVVFCSILMLATTQYLAVIDYFGAILIIAGVRWIVYRVYYAEEEIVPIV
jgi:hypothetical protein